MKNYLARKISGFRNKSKNRSINRNINEFIDYNSQKQLTARETELHPEVLIPCYNHGRFLATSLSSISGGIPVTVINDASTDDTQSIAQQLQQKNGFRLIRNEVNINQSGSLNKAIASSENNLFIILNADDYLIKYSIQTIMNLFKTNRLIRMVGGSCIPFSRDETLNMDRCLPESLNYLPHVQLYGPEHAKTYQNLNDINMTMSSCAFLKSAWKAVGGFSGFEDRVCSYDDRDFQMKVSSLFNVAVIEEPLAFYRVNSSLGRAQAL